jgi:hypothetical protein
MSDLDDEPAGGLACFISDERVCGPSCMAFMTTPADVPAFSPQQRHCVVLVSAERVARHVVVGVKLMGDFVGHVKNTSADQQRMGQKPPEVR